MGTNTEKTPHDQTDGQSTVDETVEISNGPGRSPAIEIELLGEYGGSDQLSGLRSLEGVVEHALQSETQLDRLEIIGTPGDDQYRHYLCPIDTSQRTAETEVQTAQSDTNDSTGSVQLQLNTDPDSDDETAVVESDTDDDTKETLVGTVTNAIEEYWPELNYRTGTLDLSGIADVAVPTSRLLAVEDQTLDLATEALNRGVIELLVDLIEAQIPHIYQLLLKRAGSRSDAEYIATVRLAVFDEEYGIATDADLANHLNSRPGYQYCLSKPFRDQFVTSNFDLNVQALKELELVSANESTRYRLNGQPIYQLNEPFPLEELATFSEYYNLLTGSFAADPRYERHFNRYARFPVNGGSLDLLIRIIPAYFKHSPWARTAVTDGPRFDPTVRAAATATRASGTTDPITPDTTEDRSTSKAHRDLVNSIINYLVQQGYTILAVDQQTIEAELTDPDPTTRSYFPGESQPDIVAKKDGEIRVFEAELNDSNPAAYLKNLERAAHFDYQVVVVTKTDGDLDLKFRHANRPYNTDKTPEPGPYGVRLYTLSEEVTTDEVTYFLPMGATVSKWYLSHDDRLTLVVDGTPVAHGHPEESLASILDGNVPQGRWEDDRYVVTRPSGKTERYPSSEAATNAYTPIKAPFVPTQITYLDRVEFRYEVDNAHLRKHYFNPTWARKYRNQTSKRHKASRNGFIETHTIKVEGETLFIPDVRDKHTPWHTTQTEFDPPRANWFGRKLGADFEVSDTESRDRELLNRTWIYTPGLEPEYPDFPDDPPAGTEQADEE